MLSLSSSVVVVVVIVVVVVVAKHDSSTVHGTEVGGLGDLPGRIFDILGRWVER